MFAATDPHGIKEESQQGNPVKVRETDYPKIRLRNQTRRTQMFERKRNRLYCHYWIMLAIHHTVVFVCFCCYVHVCELV